MVSGGVRSIAMLIALALQVAAAKAETFTFAVGEWPPFVARDSAGFGSHAEAVTQAFRKAGHNVRFEFLPWLRSLETTRHGSIPASFSWAFVEDRQKDFLYPETPLGEARDVYFYRKDRFPEGLEPLSFKELRTRGLTVVGISGYWYEAALRKEGVVFQGVATEEQAWTMLRHERADIFIENDVVGQAHSREVLREEAGLIQGSRPIRIVPLYILFSKAHPDGRRMLEIWDEFGSRKQVSARSYDFRKLYEPALAE
ncbi:substrate-binding periplasmic protein [Roseibium aggregatum]|uniref:Transporter substrate-binding domain-containing protein n=1 Tax=Roseibium aggregatum TaxID=187304 RepID=A0A939EJ05_9HYPH|nr:transporter substrate-binding domain-containing protein [Roseibium aggregatum]MBN9673178.1 transporter substrate-binding domain-containing protein [Roseibium aggregatum]